MDWLRLIPLILGSCCVIAGTAISWNVYRDSSLLNSAPSAIRSAEQYLNISFIYAALVAWVGVICMQNHLFQAREIDLHAKSI